MTQLWSGVVRIYFNAYTDAPNYWSVDDGDPASEVTCPDVTLRGVFRTCVRPTGKDQPRAWLFSPSARVCRHDDGRITVTDQAEGA